MKISLINTDFGDVSDSYILPLTMYYLGGILRSHNYDVKIIDPLLYKSKRMKESYENVLNKIILNSDVLLFTANSFGWASVLEDIKNIRKKGYLGHIILGGIHPTVAYEYILSKYNDLIDFICIGEGEDSLIKLLKKIKEGDTLIDIPGIAYKKDNMIQYKFNDSFIELKEIDYTSAYDLVPLGAYNTYTLECSRGCYGNCAFCSILCKRKWRAHSIENIKANILAIKKHAELEKNEISIITTDDCFTSNTKWVKDVITLFHEEGIADNFLHFEARVNQLLNPEIMNSIKLLPNYQIQVGVECGYDEGLKKIRKGFTIDNLIELCNKLENENMLDKVFFSFIIALPHESFDDCLKTIKFERFIKVRYGIKTVLNFWIPLPSDCYYSLFDDSKEIDYSIYDNKNWQMDIEIFKKTHPNLTADEYEILRNQVKITRSV